MFKDIYDGDIDKLLEKLDNLRTLKLLRTNGFELPESYKLYQEDDWDEEASFALKVIKVMCEAKEDLDPGFIPVSEGEAYGYELWSLDESQEAIEIIVPSKDVEEFLMYYKERGLQASNEDPDFWFVVNNIISLPYFNDYTYYASALGYDETEIVLLITDYGIFNSEVFERLLNVIQYCKKENERRKSNGL